MYDLWQPWRSRRRGTMKRIKRMKRMKRMKRSKEWGGRGGCSMEKVDHRLCQEGSHGVTHARLALHLRLAKNEQPYKVAGLRFNPKFISSISKGLSRCRSVSERLTCTMVLFPSTLLFSSPRYPRSSLFLARKKIGMHSCKQSTTLWVVYRHLYYIRGHWCPRFASLTSTLFSGFP